MHNRDKFKQFYTFEELGNLYHAAIQPVNKEKYPVHVRRKGSVLGAKLCKDPLDLITRADLMFDYDHSITLEIIPTEPDKPATHERRDKKKDGRPHPKKRIHR